MRVLLVSPEFPPHCCGGLGIYVARLVRELLPGVRFRVLTAENWTPHGSCASLPGVERECVPIRARRWPFRHLEFLVRANRYVREHEEEFDLVSDHSRLIRRHARPLVTTVHSTEEQEQGVLANRFRGISLRPAAQRVGLLALSAWERRHFRLADGLLTVSRSMRTYLARCTGRPDVRVASPGVDARTFTPGTRARSTDVLFVGRLHPRKGLGVLLAALDRLEPVSVTFCTPHGERSEERALRAWIETARHRVSLRLDVPHEDMAPQYRNARLLVVPSFYEPFGMVAIEAMACGTPVVASRVGGLREIIRPGWNGLLVPPGDDRALAEAMARLLRDDAERLRLAERARESALGYTWERCSESSLEAFASALRGERGTGARA